VPSWAKDPKVGARMINARAEGIAGKSAFRAPLKRRRCIIPADGFFEWKKVPGAKRKQPYFIHRTDGEPLAFAGLWEVWRGPKDKAKDKAEAGAGEARDGTQDGGAEGAGGGVEDSPLRSCTIITTSANETISELHDRMPVVLPPSAWEEWLDPTNDDVETLGKLLVPAPPELVTFHPVSTEVNKVANKGPELVAPATLDTPDQLEI
jgi:putative SOS response-associated peptidase YedK